jgi:endonuclease YncB( thermonuclease family)
VRTWVYEAILVRHVDGDTTIYDINQGMNIWAKNQYVRYAGINAPEMHGGSATSGQLAKEFLETLLPVGVQVWLVTIEYHEEDKYGRVLAVVYDHMPTGVLMADAKLENIMPGSINQDMLDSGHAVPYNPSNM